VGGRGLAGIKVAAAVNSDLLTLAPLCGFGLNCFRLGSDLLTPFVVRREKTL